MSTNLSELRAAAKLPASQVKGGTLVEFFAAKKAVLAQCLPRHMTPERMLRVAMTAIRANPRLMECTMESLAGAIITCSMLGLEPNPMVGHIYLVPFRNNRRNSTEVQVITGYKGLIQLHRNTGQISQIEAHAVYENDYFEYQQGTESYLHHRPADNPGEMKCAYAIAWVKDSDRATFRVVTLGELEKTRNMAFAKLQDWQKKQSPWTTHFPEMAMKTAIRRLSKFLPISVEIAQAHHLDDRADLSESQALDNVLNGEFEITDSEPSEAPASTQAHEETSQ